MCFVPKQTRLRQNGKKCRLSPPYLPQTGNILMYYIFSLFHGFEEEDEERVLQYNNPHIGPVVEGRSFRIHGNISEDGNLFTIDFITNLVEDIFRDIALRITGRVNEKVLTRSYRTGDKWSSEEVISRTPYKIKLTADKPVTIEVFTLEREFLIGLNGFHYANFSHRFPYSKIRILEIRGDLQDILVDQKMAIEYPFRPINSEHHGIMYNTNTGITESSKTKKDHLPLPYMASFDKEFLSECSILIITGLVPDGAKDFSVTLQTGPQYWPSPSICYDVKFYFYDETLDEIAPRKGPNNEIVRVKSGEEIKLQLVRDESGFIAFINNQKFPLRPFQFDPTYVSTVAVYGDLKLLDILIST